jgi:hypothetical protein
MTPPTFDGQRAERFAQLVDSRDPLPANDGAHTDDEAALAAIGRRLSSVGIPGQVDPKFRAEFRAVLVAAAEREQAARAAAKTSAPAAPVTPAAKLARGLAKARTLLGSSPGTRRARTRGAIIAGVAVGAIAVSGISTASEDSVPGDALYGMKRSTERAQLALAGNDTSKAELLLGFARTRADEAHAVRGDDAAFDRLLTETDSQTTAAVALLTRAAVEGKSEAPLDVVASFVAQQRPALAELLAGADPAEKTRATASLALLDAVKDRVDALRAALRCGGADTGRADPLESVPAGCTSGTGRTTPPR